MNAIQQISLKLRLGIETTADIQPDELLEKWQTFNEQRTHSALRAQRLGRRTMNGVAATANVSALLARQ